MVVLGHHTDPATGPLADLDDPILVRWSGEPTLDAVDAALEVARATRPDVIVAWGGGSVIDLAKAVGVLAHGDRPRAGPPRGDRRGRPAARHLPCR